MSLHKISVTYIDMNDMMPHTLSASVDEDYTRNEHAFDEFYVIML